MNSCQLIKTKEHIRSVRMISVFSFKKYLLFFYVYLSVFMHMLQRSEYGIGFLELELPLARSHYVDVRH